MNEIVADNFLVASDPEKVYIDIYGATGIYLVLSHERAEILAATISNAVSKWSDKEE
jgi:hypothetical protein